MVEVSSLFSFNKKLYFLLFVLIAMVVAYISQEFILTESLLYDTFGNQLGIMQIKQMIEWRQKWSWLTYLLLPLTYLAKFALVAFCLYIGLLLTYERVKFNQIFLVAMLGEIVLLIPAILKLVWFLFFQIDHTLEDLQYYSPLSLLQYLGYSNVDRWAIYPLQLVNIFELFYWFLLAYGIKTMVNRSFSKSLKLVAASYGTGLVLWVVFIMFLTVSIGS